MANRRIGEGTKGAWTRGVWTEEDERREREEVRKERAMMAGAMAFMVLLTLLFVWLAVRAFDADCDVHERYLRDYRASVARMGE